jgi:preprotein translocase subunit SecG
MSIFLTLLTVFLVMVSLLLVLITLMQRPKQEGLGAAFGGGMMNDTFGAQTSDVLQKATIWLTVAFLGTAILLAVLNTRHFEQQRNVGNILEGVQEPAPIPSFPTPGVIPPAAPQEAAPKADSTPKADSAPKAEKKSETSKADKDAKPAAKTTEPAKPATKPASTKKPASDKAPAKDKADAANSSAEKKDAK